MESALRKDAEKLAKVRYAFSVCFLKAYVGTAATPAKNSVSPFWKIEGNVSFKTLAKFCI